MLKPFEKKLADFIVANDLFQPSEKILLAVSGGADSVVLMYALKKLKDAALIQNQLFVAHINHHLRGCFADADEQFVKVESSCLKLPFICRDIDVNGFACQNKISIETAARKLRIDALTEIAISLDCTSIATAHHKNDNAETVLHRLSRGTGYRGLAGIWPKRSFSRNMTFVRPLLPLSRTEIVDYLKSRGLAWQTDHTNSDTSITRNYIRHRLIPELQKDSAGLLVDELFGLSQICRKFYKKISSLADNAWPEIAEEIIKDQKVILKLNPLSSQPEPVKIELFRRALQTIDLGERNLTQHHYRRIV